jgi:hypothetical protein
MYSVPQAYAAQSAVGLGTAGSYGVLAGDSITNTGATTINGDLGLYPGTSVTGSPVVTGASNVNNAAALAAKNDLRTAYLDAAGRTGPTLLAGGTLGGRTLVPGLYKDDGAPASLGLTGTLTLDAGGDPNAVWIFQIGSTLTTEVSSRVVLINGAQPCNVFWQVGSAATLKTSSTFVGTIMAHDDITVQNSSTINGRLLAGSQANGAGALTLDTDTITKPTCSSSSSSSSSIAGSSTNPPAVCTSTGVKARPVIIESKRISSDSIFISWGPDEGQRTFIIEYGTVNGTWAYNTKVTGFSTTLKLLPANRPIWVRVAATDGCAVGGYSEAKLAGSPLFPNAGLGPDASVNGFFSSFTHWLQSLTF